MAYERPNINILTGSENPDFNPTIKTFDRNDPDSVDQLVQILRMKLDAWSEYNTAVDDYNNTASSLMLGNEDSKKKTDLAERALVSDIKEGKHSSLVAGPYTIPSLKEKLTEEGYAHGFLGQLRVRKIIGHLMSGLPERGELLEYFLLETDDKTNQKTYFLTIGKPRT